jgi:hypothetical protein
MRKQSFIAEKESLPWCATAVANERFLLGFWFIARFG